MLDPINTVREQKKFLHSSVEKSYIAWIAVTISFHVNRLKILMYFDLEKGNLDVSKLFHGKKKL